MKPEPLKLIEPPTQQPGFGTIGLLLFQGLHLALGDISVMADLTCSCLGMSQATEPRFGPHF